MRGMITKGYHLRLPLLEARASTPDPPFLGVTLGVN
jgi:hypothetical protein